jgi:hypothetical protein
MNKRGFDQAIEDLMKIHYDGNHARYGDVAEGETAIAIARALKKVSCDYESMMTSHRKRMGRHAREEQREAQNLFAHRCYQLVDELHKGGKTKTKTAAAKKISEDGVHNGRTRAHVEYETILKHYYAIRRKMRPPGV